MLIISHTILVPYLPTKKRKNFKGVSLNFFVFLFGAIRKSVKDKAVAWDLIPGKAIKKLCKKKAKHKKEIIQKITDLINEYLESKCIPIEMCTSRLFCLNKEASETGKLDKIRPIAISSSFIKIIEQCLLSKIVTHITDKN